MEKTKLIMQFIDAANKAYSISVDNPRADLTEDEIYQAMTGLVGLNTFVSRNGLLTAPMKANIVTTSTTEIEF
ncbi:DUF2922 domain-containing protein [Soehngenia saccharolytica]|nr:DUF2922 domain-containing protein [Soehngenia saccharolytica]